MNFHVKTDLPIATQQEIDRISAITSGLRNATEVAFLANLAPYLTNEIISTDADGLIVQAAGNTLPSTYAGFKKGAMFIKKNATRDGVYLNVGDETSATWELVAGEQNDTPVNAVAATGVLTSDNTNVADGKVVVIGSQTYTFKTALTDGSTHPGEVLIGGSADGSLTNLKAAINGTGTPGTDYDSSTPVNTNVTSGNVSSHTITVTAKTKGVAANDVATTTDSAHLSWGATKLAGGVDGTVGVAGESRYDSSYLYKCIAANDITGANWRRVSLGSAY